MNLKTALDELYRDYDFAGRTAHDPISLPMLYEDPNDKAVAGLIASSFAYGKVTLFLPVAREILRRMGASPHKFLLHYKGGGFADLKYRFYTGPDIEAFLKAIHKILQHHGTLKQAFLHHDDPHAIDIGVMLASFSAELFHLGSKRFFFPTPATHGACKRACLFLRWMVRSADIDFGLWPEIGASRLIVPLDTHIARVSRCLGFTSRKGNGWYAALEITRALRALDPADPLKYDFALCHRGISGICNKEACQGCELNKYTIKNNFRQ